MGAIPVDIESLKKDLEHLRVGFGDYVPGFYLGNKCQLDNSNISAICEYLENPTKTGVWFFTSEWIDEEGISSEIIKEIEDYFVQGNSQNNEEKNSESRINLKNSPFENRKEIMEDINKFSFVFSLFTYIYQKDRGDANPQTFRENHLRREIIQSLDLEKIKEQYNDAYELFKNEIYFDNFQTSLYSDRVFKIKDSFILLNYRTKENKISLISISYSPLEKVKDFFTKLGKVKDSIIRPEYSPEEKVFTPYFSFLKEAYPHFIHDEKMIHLFKKTINEYEDRNYEYCISTLGLIAEDYLTQIYETFNRESIPKKLTLGQTYDSINSKINKQFQNKVIDAPDINPLYEKVNNLLLDNPEKDVTNYNQESAKLIRSILYFIQEDKKHTSYLMDNINKKESRLSLFPEYLKENINELIRHRNATSHNSRIPVGQYEAQRMVYCCITLIMWWKKEKDIIDWKDDKETIIGKTIERNKLSQ